VTSKLERAQKSFLGRFQEWRSYESTSDTASRDAISSSSRRAHLYRPGLTQRERDEGPRVMWGQKLEAIVDVYRKMAGRTEPVTLDMFRDDCEDLKRFMNDICAEYFWPALDNGYEPGFRLAHAQKSLAVKMKHHWCSGEILEPPSCPIDRIVLSTAGAGPDEAWTRTNTRSDYDRQLGFLLKAVRRAKLSLAKWELFLFEDMATEAR
jgi:hypothetical protein